MHILAVQKPDGIIELHIAETDDQLMKAIFKDKVPPGMTLEQISHMNNAHLMSVDKVIDHR